MSEISEFPETASFRSTLLMSKISRTKDEEFVIKINSLRFQLKHYVKKIYDIIQNNIKKDENMIYFKEINKTIHYDDERLLDRLISYLNEIINTAQLLPELTYSLKANNTFSKTFGNHIELNQSLLNNTTEIEEKLMKMFPSKTYQGLYIPNIELKEIEMIIVMIIIEEFLILTSDKKREKNNIKLEYHSKDLPQMISLLNPNFNSVIVHINHIKGILSSSYNVYLLFLTESFELAPETQFNYLNISPKYDYSDASVGQNNINKLKITNNTEKFNSITEKAPLPKKYKHIIHRKPDVTMDIIEKFIRKIDNDDDDRITPSNIMELVKANNLVFSDDQINELFEEIFSKRNIIYESQRRAPVDAKELYNASKLDSEFRYRYKKVGEDFVAESRPYRDFWLLMMKQLEIEPCREDIPPIKIEPIKALYQMTNLTTALPKINNKNQIQIKVFLWLYFQPMTIKDVKKPDFVQTYIPEGGILIQNTQNIEELYLEKDNAKDDPMNQDAFRVIVNSKIKDVTHNGQYQTIEFDTKDHYNEAYRLSKHPAEYLYEKNNPIHRFLPQKDNFVPSKLSKEKSTSDVIPSRSLSKMEYPDSEVDNSNANFDAGKDPIDEKKNLMLSKTSNNFRSTKSSLPKGIKWGSASTKVFDKNEIPSNQAQSPDSKKRLFNTTFKMVDVRTLKAQIAKIEPVVDVYAPPQNHKFREDVPLEGKPSFKVASKITKSEEAQRPEDIDYRPREVLMREAMRKERMEEQKLRQKPRAWINFIKTAPKGTNLSDHKLPEFYEKGVYEEPMGIINNLLRGEVEYDIPFKLFHRSLKKTDKTKFFGETIPSKI